jgi:hypothetical protein
MFEFLLFGFGLLVIWYISLHLLVFLIAEHQDRKKVGLDGLFYMVVYASLYTLVYLVSSLVFLTYYFL